MRSTLAADYQTVPRPVAVMAKAFADGHRTGLHAHPRAQLLYAIEGLMLVTTGQGTWAVPTGHALLIPADHAHDVAMHGRVDMRTAYLAPDEAGLADAFRCRVIRVSQLLDAALQALADEPLLYPPEGRGAHLAALVLDEVARAPDTAFALPLPADVRLRRLCQALIDAPGLDHDIDRWAQEIGMSRRTLTRGFRRETGLSFGAWRRRLRVLHTMARQAQGVALKDAARLAGYRSPQALRAMMRRADSAAGQP